MSDLTLTHGVMEADYGGQVYCTFPLERLPGQDIEEKEKLVTNLANKIDLLEWKEPEGLSIYCANINQEIDEEDLIDEDDFHDPTLVWGGMGGGHLIPKQVWIHPNLCSESVKMIKKFFQEEDETHGS